MDKAQAIHLHACLSDSYWKSAVQHAVHVYNHTSKQGLNWRTPHELLFKVPPTVFHLHIFECATYVHLPTDIHGVTEIPWVDESSKWELLSLLGDWYEPKTFNSVFFSITSDAVQFAC